MKYLFIAAIGVLALTSCGSTVHYNPDGDSPVIESLSQKETVKLPTKEIISVDLKTIEKEYQDNQIAADGKYHNKRIKFTGLIHNISSTFGDATIGFTSSKGSFLSTTTAFFKETEIQKIGKLKKGDTITVICENPSDVMGLGLYNCEIL